MPFDTNLITANESDAWAMLETRKRIKTGIEMRADILKTMKSRENIGDEYW